jgi:hypothetical protein
MPISFHCRAELSASAGQDPPLSVQLHSIGMFTQATDGDASRVCLACSSTISRAYRGCIVGVDAGPMQRQICISISGDDGGRTRPARLNISIDGWHAVDPLGN